MKHKVFIKLFTIPEDEEIVASYHCSVKEPHKVLIQGNMYLTKNYMCFYANFLGRERKVVINYADVDSIEKRATAKFVPNALLFLLKSGEKYLFRSFLNRTEALSVITGLWDKKKINVKSEQLARSEQKKDWNDQLKAAMSNAASRYDVVDKLGEGGFGFTFVVLDKLDFRHYVLKEICCESENAAKVAMKETVLLKLLKHPFIVSYRDFWQEEMHVFIVMEYCEGGDLANLITKKKPFEESSIVRWVIEVLYALEYLHSLNVLHRDIKPGNMFLNRWDDIKIGDFGLSTVRKDKKKQHQTPVGTLGYAAPELLDGKAYDEKCDMYALGCSLYEIVTLRSVYDDNEAGVFPMAFPTNYHPELEKLMKSMLKKEPAKRPNATELLKSPFLQPYLRPLKRTAEVYAELQNREEENEQLRRKVSLLEKELVKYKPQKFMYTDEDGNPLSNTTTTLLDFESSPPQAQSRKGSKKDKEKKAVSSV